jgi:hypothetical protein
MIQKTFYAILLFLSCSIVNCKAKDYSKDTLHVGVKVELNTIEEFQKTNDKQYIFNDIEINRFVWSNDTIKIIFQGINDWYDPGDFHKINLTIRGKNYSFSNIDGWVSISDYQLQFIKRRMQSELIQSDFGIVLPASESDLILIIFGYPYASKPGLVTIIYLPLNEEPYLIYNDNSYLYNYDIFNDKMQVTISTYDEDRRKRLKSPEVGLKSYTFENGFLKEIE